MTVFDYTLFMLRRAAEHDYSWSVSSAEARALVEEVEWLRGERAAVAAYLGRCGLIGAAENVRAGDHRIERGEHRREEEK